MKTSVSVDPNLLQKSLIIDISVIDISGNLKHSESEAETYKIIDN